MQNIQVLGKKKSLLMKRMKTDVSFYASPINIKIFKILSKDVHLGLEATFRMSN